MPGDDNQPPPIQPQKDLPTQNPSSPLQTLESTNPDPPNQDPDLHHLQDDPDDHEGMPITLISDSNVEEKETEIEILPPSSSSRRAPSRRKKGSVKNHPRTLAAIEKKVHVLSQKWKVIPFVPNKSLDFSRHEGNLKRLGLWEFAHLEFDRKLRADLLAKLVVTFNPKDRSSSVDGVKVRVGQADLARALSLSKKPKPEEEEEEAWPGDFLAFLEEFVSNWMLLHEDTWILPKEVVNWTGLIKEGHPEKLDWTKLIWFMVRRELSMGLDLENCYYASHLQQLIRFQKNELLREKSPMEVQEVIMLKEDEDDEVDVKMGECVEPENVHQSVGGIQSAQSDETVVNLGALGNVSDAVAHGDITNDRVGSVENPETAGDHVENLEKPVENVGSPAKAVEFVESPKNAVDHVEVPEMAVEHVEVPEMAVEHVEIPEAAVEDVEMPQTVEDAEKTIEDVDNPEKVVEQLEIPDKPVENVEHLEKVAEPLEIPDKPVENVENPEKVVDHQEENRETVVDQLENMETVGNHANTDGHVDKLDLLEAAVDLVTKLETTGDPVENMNVVDDYAEGLKIDGDNVEDPNINGSDDDVYDFKTEDEDPNADGAQIQDPSGNTFMDFEPIKAEDEQDLWDLSRKDDEPRNFLQKCTMPTSLGVDDGQPEEVEDDEDEDDEQVEGFDALQKCNSFTGLSSSHLMQSLDPSQMEYAPSEFGHHNSHLILGGPSSIFANAPKRELEHDAEINGTHKRMRTEGPSWDQKPPDFDTCFDQMQQWLEKARMAHMSTHESMVNQQQIINYELESKDHIIQQLKLSLEDQQRSHQAQVARYENELYSMASVISGYRKALKSAQLNFAEYRKRAPLPLEPLYKDAGPGGVVRTVAELEKERLKREEEDRAAVMAVTNEALRMEEQWGRTFKVQLDRVEGLLGRVPGIEMGVELLRESMKKRKEASVVLETVCPE